jgi:hypothetical protein
MESRQSSIIGGIVVVLLVVGGYLLYTGGFFVPPEPTLDELEAEVVLDNLTYNTYVTSPFTFTGQATKDWFDESGTFSIEVRDQDGTTIGNGSANMQGEVNTAGRIPFTATITFSQPQGKEGVISLSRSATFGDGDGFSYGVSVSFVPVPEEEE